MERRIGIRLPFLNEAAKDAVTKRAKALGFDTVYMDAEELEQGAAADCEVFCGMMPARLISRCEKLRWIHFSFAGVDGYTADEIYPNPQVVVTNSAGAYGITISEHLICTLLMLMRGMPRFMENQARHGWNREGEMRSIYGSTITVLGTGDIGTNFAKRAKAMGATLRGVRRSPEKETPACFDAVYGNDRLLEALKDADVVALCLPGTGETRSILTEEGLGALKPGAYVLNVGRGTAIDQPALIRALEAGHIAGAALDVTDPEPLPPEHPLWNAPNLIVTPHVSGNMSLSHTCDLLLTLFMDNLERYAKGEPLKNVVDRKAGY